MQNVISISSETAQPLEGPVDLATAAQNLGLRQVEAWVADGPRKARSAGADRTKRSRAAAEKRGVKQLSVPLPIVLHETVKAMAARACAGELAAEVWADLSPAQHRAPSLPPVKAQLRGWRRWLLRWLLPPELKALIE